METRIDIIISTSVLCKAPSLFTVTRIINNVSIKPTPSEIEERKMKILYEWAEKTKDSLNSLPMINIYRELQKQLAGDSKQMLLPAVEGILTRGLLKGRFPKINNAVDIANTVSLSHLIPIGLFDLDNIKGPIELELAVEGDSFIPIGKEATIKLSPGVPILKDKDGIFSAVGSRDSKRTMLTNKTKNILAFSWGIEGVTQSFISEALKECANKILLHS